MANFRSESGKHIITHNGKKYEFNTLRIALVFINLIKKGEIK